MQTIIYKEKLKAAKKLIQANKFEPRYFLVFTMTAGYLSAKDKKALQNFFNDLFSPPYDLAVRYELNLLASCFEECQNPSIIKQYSGFIKVVKAYIEEAPYEELKYELLNRKEKLLNHPEIVKVIKRHLSRSQQKSGNAKDTKQIGRASFSSGNHHGYH